jgi:hypothetical protein
MGTAVRPAKNWFLSMLGTSPSAVAPDSASAAARPIMQGRGPRSACRAGGMRKPARGARLKPGRRDDPEARRERLAKRKAGPLFRKIGVGGVDTKLHPDADRRILAQRVAMAGLYISTAGSDRLSAHALRVGFISAAYDKGIRYEDIMRHTRHRDLRGYV